MKKNTYCIDGTWYKTISKVTAKRYHSNGEIVYVLPENASPLSPWNILGRIMPDKDFESELNAYRYYNCNAELGKNVRFFKRI